MAKSHILPQAFANYDKEGKWAAVVYGEPAKRRQTGVWDDHILCVVCEDQYKGIDDVAAKTLLNDFETISTLRETSPNSSAKFLSADYRESIKKFLLFTLWKASATEKIEYKNVNLGKYADYIRHTISNDSDFSLYEYSFIACWIENPTAHLFPLKHKSLWGEGICYSLDFSNFIFYVKMKRKKLNSKLELLQEFENLIFPVFKETPKNRLNGIVEILDRHEKEHGHIKFQ